MSRGRAFPVVTLALSVEADWRALIRAFDVAESQ